MRRNIIQTLTHTFLHTVKSIQPHHLTVFAMGEKKMEPEKLIRNAFKMKLNPSQTQEYKKRHDTIWPELSKVLSEAGVRDYSIYFDEETNTLFAFQKLTPENTSDDLPNNPIVKKWWAYMADLMETNLDNSPVTVKLEEVFHME